MAARRAPRGDTQGPRSLLVGLVGAGIGRSLSPALHEHEAAQLGLRCVYRRLDLDVLGLPPAAIGEILSAASLVGYDGLNVTHPCKQAVVWHLDELDPTAAELGAVNTVVFTGGKTVGYNTDGAGFAQALSVGLPDVRLDRVVLLGAGGAGTAVAHALLTLGAGVVRVLDIDVHCSERLAAWLRTRFGPDRAVAGGPDDAADALVHADGLVHATPTGMAAHPGMPVAEELLRPDLWVAEVVYRPLNTELVTTARARGCRVLTGGLMAVFQAAAAFRLFTGVPPEVDRMRQHFDALIDAEAGEMYVGG